MLALSSPGLHRLHPGTTCFLITPSTDERHATQVTRHTGFRIGQVYRMACRSQTSDYRFLNSQSKASRS